MITILEKDKIVLNVDSDEERIRHIEEGWHELTSSEIEAAGMIGYEQFVSPTNTVVNEDGTITFTPPPEPTPEEQKAKLQKEYTDFIQSMLDAEAQKLGYDNCNSVCTYINSGVDKFDTERRGFPYMAFCCLEQGI